MDFKAAFEGHENNLHDKWSIFLPELLSFLSGQVKDASVKRVLDKMENNKGLSESGRDAAMIWALHGFFVPTKRIVKIDPITKKRNTTKFTIKDAQQSVLFVGATAQEVEDHLDHLRRTKVKVQPFLYAVSDDIFSFSLL